MTAPSEELRIVEAFLFASPQPVSEEEIAGRLPEGTDIKALLVELAEHYQGRGVEPVKTAERWSFRTAADIRRSVKSVAPIIPCRAGVPRGEAPGIPTQDKHWI